MPPALSDYSSGSDSDDETPLSSKVRRHNRYMTSAETTRQRGSSPPSRERTRGYLLNGLDTNNIIPPNEVVLSTTEDTTTLSVTRGSARGIRSNLAYDQRYHPIDEYLRPSQAAKRRAEYGHSRSPSFEEQGNTESDTDSDGQSQAKRRRLNNVEQRDIRRSSRITNHHVLYNMRIHPQDSQLQQMVADAVEEVTEENNEVISIGSSEAVETDEERVVRDTTGKSRNSIRVRVSLFWRAVAA